MPIHILVAYKISDFHPIKKTRHRVHRLQRYGHVSCSSGLAGRGRGGKTTSGNGQAWSSPSPRGQWKTPILEETGCEIFCGAPKTLTDKGQMRGC